ncbi:protoheme IX farnesyltransferase [Peribacillus cavernae]|uniref:Protoheme IX farnesyltransferase n=1 Tax=Peribacillus cavernae TaxID=1674310 RepID=A0A433HWU3_9BACI|nr:heme o synthase [Peribacillus cavernae]MDQ0218047.1 protoheme IX farnesyltransferase [Peribacillus cavernae]RUQ32792.1 protoheme IX farnesyltransferase [Peribacillus cavernae]
MKNTEAVIGDSLPIKTYLSWSVLKAIVKDGIVKSNLLGMFAGLSVALSIHNLSFIDNILTVLLALFGTAFVVGGAGAINNYYDRDIDAHMKRTMVRPTVTGSVNPIFALWLGIVLAIVGIALLLLISGITAFVGFLGLFLYLVPYTMWTKRKTIYNTEVGSLSGAIAPLIGWVAISPEVIHPISIGLFMLMFLWQPPHFYAIAIRRLEDYKNAGVPMLPVVKGIHRTKVQTIVYLVILLASSFLFLSFSKVVAFTMFGLTLAWMLAGIIGFRKMEDYKWGTMMFVFSLNHLTILFSLLIIVSFI